MHRLLLSILSVITILLNGCTDIASLEPAQKNVYVKIYSDIGDNYIADIKELSDGYLLGGININNDTTTTLLIKTDELGNKVWAQTFPDWAIKQITLIDGGYILCGSGIHSNNTTKAEMIKTDANGNELDKVVLGGNSINYHGVASTLLSDNSIVMLGYYQGVNDVWEIFLNGYDTDFEQSWQGVSIVKIESKDLIPQPSLYETPDGQLSFLMTRSDDGVSGLVYVTLPVDRSSENTSIQINGGVVNIGTHHIPVALGYAMAGSFSEKLGGDEYMGIAKTGIDAVIKPIILKDNSKNTDTPPSMKGRSLSLTLASDGGFMVLGSAPTIAGGSREDNDFVLVKTDFSGNTVAEPVYHGGSGNETNGKIIKAADGGFVIFGTSEFEGMNQMYLIKTNKEGKLKE